MRDFTAKDANAQVVAGSMTVEVGATDKSFRLARRSQSAATAGALFRVIPASKITLAFSNSSE